MRLDPVYLASSDAPAGSTHSRRAFLLAGGTFVAGVSLGSAGGDVAGGGGDGDAPAAASGRERERDELRRLAASGTADELVDARFRLLHFVASDDLYDAVLWSGVARLGRACLTYPSFPDRVLAAQWIARRLDEAPRAAAAHSALSLRLKRLR
jgi:hypothetical protein